MRKVKNVPVIVKYTLVQVKLDKSYTDKFQLTYARGKDLNRSDLVIPNKDDILIFNAKGASACTFQIKPDGSIRNKKLKVVLHRSIDPVTTRIYGHLVIDLSKYYHRGMEITDDIPMETAHTLSPILTFKCLVKRHHSKSGKKGTSATSQRDTEGTLEDIDDSFEEKYYDSERDEFKKKKNAAPPVTESRYMTTSEIMITDDDNDNDTGTQQLESEHVEEKEEIEEEDDDEEDKIEPPPEKQNKSGANLVDGLKRFSKIIQSNTVPAFKALAKPKDEPKIPVDEVFRKLLTEPIPPPMEYSYMDSEAKSAPFPGAVYPIYQTIHRSKLFISNAVNQDEFRNAINIFYEKFPTAPLCEDPPKDSADKSKKEEQNQVQDQSFGLAHDNFKDDFDPYFAPNETGYVQRNASEGASVEQRFLTTLMILLITSYNSAQYGYSPERTSDFTNHLVSFMNTFARRIYGHYLCKFEDPITTLAMGRFNQIQLLDEFIQIYDSVVDKFKFLPSINKYLTNCFNNSLDALIFNKILSNPARFTFSKAAIWNSFFTALKSQKSLCFPLTIQLVSCLMMAVNIATEQPKDGEEELRIKICPDLDPKLIIYILKNYRPDNMNEMSINYRLAAQRLNVPLDNLRFVPIKPQDNNDYQGAGDSVRITNWQYCQPNGHLVQEYPFMKASKKL